MSKSNDQEQTLSDQTIADGIAGDDVEATENTGSDMSGDNVPEKDEAATDSEDGTPSAEEATHSDDVSDDVVEESTDSAEEASQDDMVNEENGSQDNPDAINESAADDANVASSDDSDSDSESTSDVDADVNAESAGDDEHSDENGTDSKSKPVFKKPTRIAILATSEFDKVIATYNFKGHSYTITAAEVAEYAGTDYGQDDDANANSNNPETNENENSSKDENTYYDIPSTEDVIAAIRDKILTKEMDDKGIKASEKQIKKYAKDNYGSDDFDSLASQYGVDKKVVKHSITRSVRIRQLYKQITGGNTPDSPNAPTTRKRPRTTVPI